MVVTQLNSVLGFPSVLVFSALVLLSLQPFRLLGSSQCQTHFNSVISTGPLTASSLGPLFLKLTDLIYFRGFKHQLHPSFGPLAICFSYLQTYLASDVATLMSLSILMYSKQAQIPWSFPQFLPVAQAGTTDGITSLTQCLADQHISPASSLSLLHHCHLAQHPLFFVCLVFFFCSMYQKCALTDSPALASVLSKSLIIINTSSHHPAVLLSWRSARVFCYKPCL